MSGPAESTAVQEPTPTPTGAPRNAVDAYFKITERGSSVLQEIRGGVATFFTMAYIVVLNPLIIGTVADKNGGFVGGASSPAEAIPMVAAATALVAGVMTLVMGVVGRYPFALATGLGLNAFVAFGIASKMSWADAMGIVVLEGLIITVLVLVGARRAIFLAIPGDLKIAISVGIGLFIALIGFVDAGFVRRSEGGVPIELGIGGNLNGWPTFVFVVGLLLTAVLVAKKVKGGILIGIITTAILAIIVEAVAKVGGAFDAAGKPNPEGWRLIEPKLPEKLVGIPDLGIVGHFSLLGSWQAVGGVTALLFVFTLMLSDFFDTMGTVVGVGKEADLLDEKGDLPGSDRVLLVDSLAAVAGGAASVSSNTTYIESAAGVGEGARTGLASVVTGVLFLLAMFFTPLVAVVPFEAATPALVIVGFLMMTQIRDLNWNDYGIGIPAFLTMVLMPFTYNITVGIGAGLVSYVVIRAFQGRSRELHPLLWVTAALFLVYFAIAPIEQLLGVK
ncbi:MAG: adenine/guanine/hypoxanthine permease [Actinomycetota bacterium]|jgi:AGZA family xanthine/uracil permease-like MFS transporter|nr:Xanthine/uracil/vitamin permease [Cryptosporangiaceae bacterium]MDQ1679118.1 adenine/guanine/hypoxanthine permease [Actinomycetota bacterium]